jgi:hypothetical protein
MLLLFNLFVDFFLFGLIWGLDVFDQSIVPWDSRLELTGCFCLLQLLFLCLKIWITRPFGHSTVQIDIANSMKGVSKHPMLVIMEMPVQDPSHIPPWRVRLRNSLVDAPIVQNWMRDFVWQFLTLWGISDDHPNQEAAFQMVWQFIMFLVIDALVLAAAYAIARRWGGESDLHPPGWTPRATPSAIVRANRYKAMRRTANIVLAPAVGYLLWDFAGYNQFWAGPKGVSVLMGIFEAIGQLWWHWDLDGTLFGIAMFLLTSIMTLTPGAIWKLVALLLTDYSRLDFRIAASVVLATAVALQNALVAITAFTLHEAVAGDDSALLLEPPSLCGTSYTVRHHATRSSLGGKTPLDDATVEDPTPCAIASSRQQLLTHAVDDGGRQLLLPPSADSPRRGGLQNG